MADVKFNGFTDGDQLKVGDIVVGLRAGANTKFDFPDVGFKDTNGNYLLQYATAGAAAVNYPLVTNSLTTAKVIYGAAGTDADIGISVTPKGAGEVNIPANVIGVTRIDVDNIRIDGNAITSTNANGDLTLTPNGTGDVVLDGLNWPQADGSANTLLYTNGAAQLAWTTATFPVTAGSAGTILRSNGTNWVNSTSTFADTYLINTILYAGTANTITGMTAAARGVLVSDNSSVPSMLASASTTGQVLQGSTTGTPTWSTPTYPSASGTAGKVIRADGTNNAYSTATFADTYAVSTILYAASADAVSGLATTNRAALSTSATGVPTWLALTDGQLVVGSTAGAPAAATLTAGANVGISVGSNSITISSTGGSGYVWTEVSGTSQQMAVDNAYVANNAGLVTFTLPDTASVGDTVIVQGKGAGGWLIAQNAGESIHLGSSTTTVGVGGSLASTNRYDSIELVCITADTEWATVTGPMGVITVV